MARKQTPSTPIQRQLSITEMSSAITKIDRRLTDLTKFDVESIDRGNDPSVVVLEHKIDQLLLDIFGAESAQYNRYCGIKDLYHPSLRINYTPPPREIRDHIKNNLSEAIAVLQAIKDGFLEELEDSDEGTSGRVIKAYKGLDLHPEIARAANKLYLDGHYANAIEDAVKALNNYVRLRSGVSELDGVPLMERVFSQKNPILKFNDLLTESDHNEQKGFMQWFCGAVTGLRNPRAHTIIQDDPETSLEYIAFISLLAKLVDKAEK